MPGSQHDFFGQFSPELIHHLVGCLDSHSIDDLQARQFSSVCSSFRRAIINTPQLYELIAVNLDGNHTDGMYRWLQLKVERSKPSCNLHISLIARGERTPGGAILDTIVGCCERWGTLELFIHPLALDNLLHPVEGRLRSLRQLHLYFALAGVPETIRSLLAIPQFFRDLPLLEDISILPLPTKNLTLLPLHQITHCRVAFSPNSGEVHPTLSTLFHPKSRLKTLEIQMHLSGTNSWDGGGPFYAPYLIDLELASVTYIIQDQQAYSKLLDNLTAPSLKRLSAWFDNICSTTFLRLAERSRWAIESLKIYWNSPFDGIIPLFRISSSLTELILRIDDFARLRKFPQFKDPAFLPNLANWRLDVSWSRYNGGRRAIEFLTNPIGEPGDLSFLDDIGLARCELRCPSVTSIGQLGRPSYPLLSFELNIPCPCMAQGDALRLASLQFEECDLDMGTLQTWKGASAALGELYQSWDWSVSTNTEKLSATISAVLAIIQKVKSAQYLYVSLSFIRSFLGS